MVWGYLKSGIPAAYGKIGGNQGYTRATFVKVPASLGRVTGYLSKCLPPGQDRTKPSFMAVTREGRRGVY